MPSYIDHAGAFPAPFTELRPPEAGTWPHSGAAAARRHEYREPAYFPL
jgi:hypothetical protein